MGTRFDDDGNAINPARAAGDWSAFYKEKALEYANTSRSEREVSNICLQMFDFIKAQLAKQGFSDWSSTHGFYAPWVGGSYSERQAVGFEWTRLSIQTKALELGWDSEIICDGNGRLI